MKVASDSETEPGKVSDPEDGMMSLHFVVINTVTAVVKNSDLS